MQCPADSTTPPPRARRVLLFGVLAGFVLRLVFIFSGLCDGNVLADDAYYYFTIAHNIVAGAGPTFDGLAPTNGFHPLYELLLVPVFGVARAVSPDPLLPVHAALALCAAFDAATALLLATILGRLGHRSGGTIAAWLWSLSPVSVLLTLRGLEGAVSAFAVCLTLLVLTAPERPWSRPAPAIRLGLAIGLAFLARTDNGPLVALAVLAFSVFDPPVRGATAPAARRVAVAGGGTLGGAAIVVAPWLLWNLATFGNMVQVSGLAKAHNRSIFGALPELHGADAVAGWIARLGAPVLFLCRYLAGEEQRLPRVTFVLLGLTAWVLVFALLLLRRAWQEPRSPLERPLLAFAAVFTVAHLGFYGFVLGSYVVWYTTVPLLLATLVIGGIAGGRLAASSSRPARLAWCGVLLAIGIAAYANFFQHVSHGSRAREAEAGRLLRAIHARFPTVRAIGGFNVGATAYFSTARGGLRVVNLDGLVNNALYDASRHGRVLEYLEHNVDFIVMDAPATMRGWLRDGEWDRLIERYPRYGQTLFYGPRRDETIRR